MRKLGFVLALLASPAVATEMTIEVEGEGANGTVTIDLLEDVAPGHVAQISALAQDGAYDGVVFHRVIEGFMAQTGDVKFGKMGMDMRRAGTGASDRPNLKAEFSDVPFDRGVVGMARSQSPDSANSQFFIMFDEGHFLNGQYTVVGRVTGGMDVVDAIKRGDKRSGAITGQPDMMKKVTVSE
ncbi:peptidylprolyl isomerase [Rhodobacteraceae bacterium LMO-12]|nr:peptidylprolyl isomerase [Rhodobacteraceae bacterium LMO-JJ12]